MAAEARSRNTNRFGLSTDTLNEVQGIVILFLAIACLLSIASANRRANLIGPAGAYVAQSIIFALGEGLAYAVPAILMIWGITRLRGIAWSYALVKVVGLGLIVLAGCGLLSMFGYDFARFIDSTAHRDLISFRWGGALGAFLVSGSGANLPRYLGEAGTYLALGAGASVGLLLATNFLFYQFFLGMWRRARTGQQAVSGKMQRWIERSKDHKSGRVPRVHRRRLARIFGAPDPDDAQLDVPPDLPPAPPEPREVELPVLESEIGAVDEEQAGGPAPVNQEPDEHDELYAASPEQLDLFEGYQIPPIDILDPPPPTNVSLSQADIDVLSRTVEEKLASFGIGVEVTDVTQGPVVTLFEVHPASGVKINRIVTLENDLAMALRASRLRIIAPIPGRGTVGIEIPNRKPNIVCLREILESRDAETQTGPLVFGLGKTIEGRPYACNLAKMPHLLIAGATGSGKSVCLNAIICSMLFRNPPDRVRFIMIDPKRVELSIYQGIPHLLAPVVCDPRKAAAALAWVVGQMEGRYRVLSEHNVRSIDGYNRYALDDEKARARFGREVPYMPHIVIIVDELADLMFVARNEVEGNVIRLAQMSRAVGIHLIIATQRPSVNVITGIIKANFPCRVAFQVSQKVDSRTILDMNGAEALLGQGDMLFSPAGSMRPIRIQGAYVSDQEVEQVVSFITSQSEALTEEQLEAERQIDSVRLQADQAESGIAVAEPAEEVEAEEDEEDEIAEASVEEGPRSIDDAERVLGAERERPPVRVQYAVEDFTAPGEEEGELEDDLYDKALRLLLESKKASVSLIQRRMKIGYARAGRLMDMMEDRGVVGPYQGSKPRQLLVDPVEYLARLDARTRAG